VEISRVTADLKLALPIRYTNRAVTRAPGESDDEWAKREGQTEIVPLVWAYHTPIARDVFEAHWRVISATSATLLKKGVSPSIVSVATLALKDAGRQDALEYGLVENASMADGGNAAAVLRELKRLTLVLSPGPGGYEMFPVDVAIARGAIDAEDWLEAEASLVFFTCGFCLATRQRKALSAESLASVLEGSITSLDPSAFAASLNPSMPAPSFAMPTQATRSLVPS
jgi:hypothetical protein